MLSAKNTMSSSNHFEAQMYLLDTSEGGRVHPLPVSIFLSFYQLDKSFDD